MEQADLEKIARKRVQMKRSFVMHLALYAFVNGSLFIIWLVTGRGYPWFLWPLAGWGVGIVANALAVFMELYAPEQRAVERELHRLSHP